MKRPTAAPPWGNLFDDVPQSLPEEQFDILHSAAGLKLERIVSTGQATPDGEWYDQGWDEWVVLLQGGARLRFDGEAEDRSLGPGDHVLIPAHVRHRVTWTDPDRPTVWLALHTGAEVT